MLKKIISKSFFLLCFILAITSCKNFFNSGDFIEQLEDSIENINTPEVELYIEADVNSGVISPNGKISVKPKNVFSVIFKESDNYQFLYWNVIDRNTKENVSNAVEIIKTEGNETEFKLLTNRTGLAITPVCAERLSVSCYPELSEKGVERDSSIILTFNKTPSADNDFEKITITSNNEDAKALYYKEPVLTENVLTFATKTDSIIPVLSGTRIVTVSIPEDFYYKVGDYKVTPGRQINYSFKLNSTTDEKAEITFTVSPDCGTVIPNGTNKYNIDEEIKIEYSPKEGIDFRGWNIVDGEGNNVDASIIEIKEPEEYKTNVVIHKGVKGIVISPESVFVPTYSSLLPVESKTGNVSPQDTNIVIKFNTPVELSDFYDKDTDSFKNISIVSNNMNLIAGSTSTEKFKYYERPVISDDKKTITIATNKNNLQMQRVEKGQPATMKKDVTVTLYTKNIYAKEVKMNFTSDISWTYTIDNTVDSLEPQIENIKIYKDSQLTQELSSAVFTDDWTVTELKKNYVSKFYVKVTGYDEGGGVKSLKLTERLWRKTDGSDVTATSEDTTPNYFSKDINNESFKNIGNGFYEAVVPVTFSNMPDGIVQVRLALCDYTDNVSSEVVYYVLKDTTLEQLDICPPEEGHEIISYVNSNFRETTYIAADPVIVKYGIINNDFIRIPDSNIDTIKISANICENNPYPSFESPLSVTKLLISNSIEESSFVEVPKNIETNSYIISRNANSLTYIKIFAEDGAGNKNSIVRVIPETPVILDTYEPTRTIDQYSALNTVTGINITKTGTPEGITYKTMGYYTLYKYEDDIYTENSFKIATNTNPVNKVKGSLADRYRGYSSDITPVGFSYNPSESVNVDNMRLASTVINDLSATKEDYNDFRPEGNYYIYLLPYIEFDERTYFGALSEPVILNVSYDSSKKRNICSKITQTGEILDSDLPESFIVEKTTGSKSSGLSNITIILPSDFIKNPDLTYFYRVRKYKNDSSAAEFYFNSEKFVVDTLSSDSKYFVTMGVKNTYGKTKYLDETKVQILTNWEDNIPPTISSSTQLNILNQYVILLKKDRQGETSYYPYDENKMLTNSEGNVEIKYCLKKFENNQESFIEYTVEQLENEKKETVEYNEKTFTSVIFPYSNYIENGLYTMCLEYEDIYHNKGVLCFEVSTLLNREEDKYTVNYASDNKLTFKIDLTENGTQKHYIEYLDDSNNWKIYQQESNHYYSFSDNSGGNHKYSSATIDFTELGGGNRFIKVNGNYIYSDHLRHFPTLYILPEYLKNPEAYPCKVQSYINTDSGNHEIIVFSDIGSPTLVRTVYSNINLNNVSAADKDVEIWSLHGTEVTTSLKQDTGNFNYSVPVDSPEIPNGYWYTTIIHFANGDMIMTTPKQK